MASKCPVCGEDVLRKGGYLVTGHSLAEAEDELHDVALERDPALQPYDRALHAERMVKQALKRPEREWLFCTACGMGLLPDPAARQAAAQAALAWWTERELPPAPLALRLGERQRRAVFPAVPLPWVVILGAAVGAAAQGVAHTLFIWAFHPGAPPLASLAVMSGMAGRFWPNALPGVLFAYGLAAVDRLAPRRTRLARWALAGGATGLVTGTVVQVLRGGRLAPSVFVPELLQALVVTAAAGLLYAAFAAWRRAPILVFGLAGAAAGVVNWLGPSLSRLLGQWLLARGLAGLSSGALPGASPGPQIAAAVPYVAGSALFGACFGLAIMASGAWTRRQEAP